MRRLRHLLHRHRWAYFVDGSVCRSCEKCGCVEYDLPGVGHRVAPSNKNRSWL